MEEETTVGTRRRDWRDHLDDRGRPTCAPAASKVGCHYCGGPLDAKDGVGQYECPWCIAKFPEHTVSRADIKELAWAIDGITGFLDHAQQVVPELKTKLARELLAKARIDDSEDT